MNKRQPDLSVPSGVYFPTRTKKMKNDRGVKIVFTVIFAVYTALLFIPFIWILLNSFKDKATFLDLSISTWSLPKEWAFSNYTYLFQLGDIKPEFNVVRMLFYSLVLCLLTPTLGIISTTLAAYVMAKYKFKGRRFIYAVFMIPMLICISGTQASVIRLFHNMGWFDAPFLGIAFMSCCGTGMNFLLLLSIFKSTSDTYMEAARIDGASELRIFGQIMLPHAMGVIGTLWVLGFIGAWNDYGTSKLFLSQDDIYTIAHGIQIIQESVLQSKGDPTLINNLPVLYAAIIVSLIPVIIIFLIFQKQIMKLSLGGGIK